MRSAASHLKPMSAQTGIIAAVALAIFCTDVDFFALNLALPATARSLGVTTTDLQWAVTIYQLTLASLLIPAGRLGDLLGRRRVLLTGIAIFGLASLLCGAAQSATMLVCFRFVQGAGAALLFPVGIAVVSNAFASAARGRAIGNVYAIGAIGTAVGPFVGGLLTDTLSWRWVFFFNVPFALAAFLITLRQVPESRDGAAERVDTTGLACVVAGIAAVTVAIDRGSDWGWLSATTLLVAAGGIALLGAFVAVERRVRFPLVDLSLFRNAPYVTITLAGAAGNIGTCLMLFLASIYLQQVRDLSPLVAGVVFLAPAIANAAGGVVAGRLGERGTPPRLVMGAALALGAVALALLAFVTAWPAYVAAFALAGFGLGTTWSYTSVGTQAVVPEAMAGGASGVTLAIVVGLGGLSVAVGATLLEVLTGGGASAATAIHRLFAGLAVLALLSAAAMLATGRAPRDRTT
ncbi:MAG: major facilitator superfamily 1 [Solirubrobacterales bacterium]|jgi:MFS family permease|nr:major facilitator superfamily 1 [Solirubrobacterales bacterium]